MIGMIGWGLRTSSKSCTLVGSKCHILDTHRKQPLSIGDRLRWLAWLKHLSWLTHKENMSTDTLDGIVFLCQIYPPCPCDTVLLHEASRWYFQGQEHLDTRLCFLWFPRRLVSQDTQSHSGLHHAQLIFRYQISTPWWWGWWQWRWW